MFWNKTQVIKKWDQISFRFTDEMIKKNPCRQTQYEIAIKIWVSEPIFNAYEDRCHDHTSLPLTDAKCWYVIIVCIMYDVSLMYNFFRPQLKLHADSNTNNCYIWFFILYRCES